ncbi:MAG TPA: NHL repeat-containing protein [Terracidiphilus sp.]|jgi:streptogramin lyase
MGLRLPIVCSGRLHVLVAVILSVAGFAPRLAAQTAHFSFAVLELDSDFGLNAPFGVAVDKSGNLFVADTLHNGVKEIPAAGGYTTVRTLGSGFNDPCGVAVDKNGNVFVADRGNNAVKEILAAGGYTTVNTLGSGFTGPRGVAVGGSGNVFVADSDNDAVKEILAAGGYTTVKTLASGLITPTNLAVDLSGNVFFTETGAVMEITASSGYAHLRTIVQSSASQTFAPNGVAVDGNSNVFFNDSYYGGIIEVVGAGGYGLLKRLALFGGSFSSMAMDTSGDFFFPDFQRNTVWEVQPGYGDFGSVNVGSVAASTITLYFRFDGGAQVGSTVVVSQGAQGLDFTKNAPCPPLGAGYMPFSYCTVVVGFNPKRPGPRYGAVEILDRSGNLITSANFMGTGVGPEATFARVASGSAYLPGAQKAVGSGFDHPYGIAVDGAGNTFVTDTYNNVLKEVVAAGGYTTVKTLGTGFSFPTGIAMDGGGNLFIADSDSDSVKEVVAVGGYTSMYTIASGFNHPASVAVDKDGNVFVADENNSAVKEIVAAGGYTTVNTLGSGFDFPTGVAVDPSGNVFVADTYNNAVKEIVAAGGYTTINTLGSGFNHPTSLALDAAGDVWVTDELNGVLKEIVAVGGYTTVRTLGSGFTFPEAVALDGTGNVYVSDLGNNQVTKLLFAGPPTLNFASTNVGAQSKDSPQKVGVSNVGNSPLTIVVPASGNNPSISAGFKLDAATTCPNVSSSSTAGTLSNGRTCLYAVDFVPAAAGTASGALTLTDDNLNAAGPAYATQSVSLNGTGLDVPFGVLGQAVDNVTLTSTVSQSHSLLVQGWVADPADGAPLNNVTVEVDGASIGTPTLGITRSDVAAKFGSAYLSSGYKLVYPAASLSLGTHQVTVVAVDAGGRSTTLGPLTITVQ